MPRQQIHTVRRTVDVSPAAGRQFKRLPTSRPAPSPIASAKPAGRLATKTGIWTYPGSRNQPRPLAVAAEVSTCSRSLARQYPSTCSLPPAAEPFDRLRTGFVEASTHTTVVVLIAVCLAVHVAFLVWVFWFL